MSQSLDFCKRQLNDGANILKSHTLKPTILKVVLWGFACLLVASLLGLALGRISIGLEEIWQVLSGGEGQGVSQKVILGLRLPRVVMGALAGAGLALGGLSFQCVLRNPLAEPYILGISGGAAVGTILSVLLGLSLWGTSLGAFLGCFAVLALALLLRWENKLAENILLCGVMINAFCGAIILLLISLARNNEISRIMFWFMGNLGAVGQDSLLTYVLLCLPPCVYLIFSAHKMNLLLLGEDAAESLGVNVARQIRLILVVSSFLVANLVVAAGPIGFVGLVVPQVLRLVFGADHRLLAPACAFFGASFLIICDLIARTLPEQGELPVGVVTALIGVPIFIYLQRKSSCKFAR